MISLNPASISNEEQAEIHPCPETVTTGDPGRETPLDRCQDPVSNYADTARSRGFPRLYPLARLHRRGAHLQEQRDFVVDRTGHSRNKLDRYTVLESCLEFNRDTISCASSPRPVHAIYWSVSPWRGNGCFDDLSLCHAICQPDSFHADHEKRFHWEEFMDFVVSARVCARHDFIKLFASCNFTLDRSSKPAYRGSFLLG